MLDQIYLFAFGLLLLIKGGDWFVDGATAIARRFHLPELLIGATVVSIGTTLPEVLVSATAAVQGNGSIAYGNAIGSIICNTALIAAVTIAIKPGKIDKKAIILPVCFFFTSAVFYSLTAYIGGRFTRLSGIILLVGFVLVSSTLGWLIRTAAMKEVDPTVVAVMMPFSSVVTVLASVVVGTDSLSPSLLIGAAIGLAAIILSGLAERKKRTATEQN